MISAFPVTPAFASSNVDYGVLTIDKGRRSGKPKPAAEVLDRLEQKYTKIAKDRAK
jgi:hypothetical protein